MLNNISLYGYTTFCLCIHLLDIWIVSTFWLLGIMLLRTFMCKFLCGHMISIILGIYLGVELLGHMVTFWATTQLLSTAPTPFYIPTSKYQFFCILTNTCYCPFFGLELYYWVWSTISLWFLICISWLKMLSIFSWAYWPFVCLSWRNIYSNH